MDELLTNASAPARCTVDDPVEQISKAGLLQRRGYVGGKWLEADEHRCFAVLNPATGTVVTDMAMLSRRQSIEAVTIATNAFKSWSQLVPQARGSVLKAWHQAIISHRETLALLMTIEQGKPLSESRGEIDYAADFVEFYAEESKRLNIESVTSHLADASMRVMREPCGVAALVTPWNFPSAMITRKAAAALAAGCTVVIHPSKETPFSATALAALANEAGIPPGVFNVVPGEATEVVQPWLDDVRVRVFSFTGSTEIGRLLYAGCARTIKRVVMELGGHAPFIVFADADIEHAVEEAIKAKFATSGQDCLGVNRFLVQYPVYEKFCALFVEKVKKLKVGSGLDDCDIGPLINECAVAKQERHVEDAVARGAKLLAGGKPHAAGRCFFEPTVLAGVSDDALIFREETFGPVAAISNFETEEEAIARANDTEYGLVAYLHSRCSKRLGRVSRALSYGMVAINRTKITGASIPFGGMKQSGLGREGSRLGMEAFTDVKYVCENY